MNSLGWDFRLGRTVFIDPRKSRKRCRMRHEGAASTPVPRQNSIRREIEWEPQCLNGQEFVGSADSYQLESYENAGRWDPGGTQIAACTPKFTCACSLLQSL